MSRIVETESTVIDENVATEENLNKSQENEQIPDQLNTERQMIEQQNLELQHIDINVPQDQEQNIVALEFDQNQQEEEDFEGQQVIPISEPQSPLQSPLPQVNTDQETNQNGNYHDEIKAIKMRVVKSDCMLDAVVRLFLMGLQIYQISGSQDSFKILSIHSQKIEYFVYINIGHYGLHAIARTISRLILNIKTYTFVRILHVFFEFQGFVIMVFGMNQIWNNKTFEDLNDKSFYDGAMKKQNESEGKNFYKEQKKMNDCIHTIHGMIILRVTLFIAMSIIMCYFRFDQLPGHYEVKISIYGLDLLSSNEVDQIRKVKKSYELQNTIIKKSIKYKSYISKFKGPQVASQCDCCICLDEFLSQDKVNYLGCSDKHVFHQDCLIGWIKKTQTCPICRKNLEI